MECVLTAHCWDTVRIDEPGLMTTPGNGKRSQDALQKLPENPALSTTDYVRAPVVPEIQASLGEVGMLLPSPGPLDQDSTIILSGAGSQSPRRWKCNPNSEKLPTSDNWTVDLITSTPVSVQQTLLPNQDTSLDHQPALIPTNNQAPAQHNQPLTQQPRALSLTLLLLDRVFTITVTLLIRRTPIPTRSSGARFFDCLLIGLIGYIQQNGVKNFRSLRSRTYSHPLFQNVTTAVECSALVLL